MRLLLLVTIVLMACVVVWANDGRVEGEGGRMHLVVGETTRVRMVCETVSIDVYLRYYDVTADFTFHNNGPATTVRMGFPESGGGDGVDGRSSRFLRFSTSVDGQPAHVHRQFLSHGEDYLALWVKSVHFRAGQSRQIRVTYRSKPGDVASEGNYVSYNFTGGNWAGTVQHSRLFVTLHLPGTIFTTLDLPDTASLGTSHWHEQQLILDWKNWQAQGNFALGYRQTMAGALLLDYTPRNMNWQEAIISGGPYTGPLEWMPPAFQRNRITYISLNTLAATLEEHGMSAEMHWKPDTKEALLMTGTHQFRFRCGSSMMEVDGKLVSLPAPPSLIGPAVIGDIRSPHLFVPIPPVIKVLGGSFIFTPSLHRLRIDIPLHKRTQE